MSSDVVLDWVSLDDPQGEVVINYVKAILSRAETECWKRREKISLQSLLESYKEVLYHTGRDLAEDTEVYDVLMELHSRVKEGGDWWGSFRKLTSEFIEGGVARIAQKQFILSMQQRLSPLKNGVSFSSIPGTGEEAHASVEAGSEADWAPSGAIEDQEIFLLSPTESSNEVEDAGLTDRTGISLNLGQHAGHEFHREDVESPQLVQRNRHRHHFAVKKPQLDERDAIAFANFKLKLSAMRAWERFLVRHRWAQVHRLEAVEAWSKAVLFWENALLRRYLRLWYREVFLHRRFFEISVLYHSARLRRVCLFALLHYARLSKRRKNSLFRVISDQLQRRYFDRWGQYVAIKRKHLNIMRHVMTRWNKRSLMSAFKGWRDFISDAALKKRSVTKCVLWWRNHVLMKSFRTWVDYKATCIFEQRRVRRALAHWAGCSLHRFFDRWCRYVNARRTKASRQEFADEHALILCTSRHWRLWRESFRREQDVRGHQRMLRLLKCRRALHRWHRWVRLRSLLQGVLGQRRTRTVKTLFLTWISFTKKQIMRRTALWLFRTGAYTRVFEAWSQYTVRKKSIRAIGDIVASNRRFAITLCASQYWQLWRQALWLEKETQARRQVLEARKGQRAFRRWHHWVRLRSLLQGVLGQRRTRTVKALFLTWISFTKKQIMRRAALRLFRTGTYVRVFDTWRQYAARKNIIRGIGNSVATDWRHGFMLHGSSFWWLWRDALKREREVQDIQRLLLLTKCRRLLLRWQRWVRLRSLMQKMLGQRRTRTVKSLFVTWISYSKKQIMRRMALHLFRTGAYIRVFRSWRMYAVKKNRIRAIGVAFAASRRFLLMQSSFHVWLEAYRLIAEEYAAEWAFADLLKALTHKGERERRTADWAVRFVRRIASLGVETFTVARCFDTWVAFACSCAHWRELKKQSFEYWYSHTLWSAFISWRTRARAHLQWRIAIELDAIILLRTSFAAFNEYLCFRRAHRIHMSNAHDWTMWRFCRPVFLAWHDWKVLQQRNRYALQSRRTSRTALAFVHQLRTAVNTRRVRNFRLLEATRKYELSLCYRVFKAWRVVVQKRIQIAFILRDRVARMMRRQMTNSFMRWQDYATYHRQLRVSVEALRVRYLLRQYRLLLSRWRAAVEIARSQERTAYQFFIVSRMTITLTAWRLLARDMIRSRRYVSLAFDGWRQFMGNAVAKKQSAMKCVLWWRNHVLMKSFRTWVVYKAACIDELRCMRRALAHWAGCCLHRFFDRWCRYINARRTKTSRHDIASKYAIVLCSKRHWRFWCEALQREREVQMHQLALDTLKCQRALQRWHRWVRLRSLLQGVLGQRRTRTVKTLFLTWISFTKKQIMRRAALRLFRTGTYMRVFEAWRHYTTKLNNVRAIGDSVAANRRLTSLQSCWLLWVQSYRVIADEIAAVSYFSKSIQTQNHKHGNTARIVARFVRRLGSLGVGTLTAARAFDTWADFLRARIYWRALHKISFEFWYSQMIRSAFCAWRSRARALVHWRIASEMDAIILLRTSFAAFREYLVFRRTLRMHLKSAYIWMLRRFCRPVLFFWHNETARRRRNRYTLEILESRRIARIALEFLNKLRTAVNSRRVHDLSLFNATRFYGRSLACRVVEAWRAIVEVRKKRAFILRDRVVYLMRLRLTDCFLRWRDYASHRYRLRLSVETLRARSFLVQYRTLLSRWRSFVDVARSQQSTAARFFYVNRLTIALTAWRVVAKEMSRARHMLSIAQSYCRRSCLTRCLFVWRRGTQFEIECRMKVVLFRCESMLRHSLYLWKLWIQRRQWEKQALMRLFVQRERTRLASCFACWRSWARKHREILSAAVVVSMAHEGRMMANVFREWCYYTGLAMHCRAVALELSMRKICQWWAVWRGAFLRKQYVRRVVTSCLTHQVAKTLGAAFTAWHSYTTAAKVKYARLASALHFWRSNLMGAAFNTWRQKMIQTVCLKDFHRRVGRRVCSYLLATAFTAWLSVHAVHQRAFEAMLLMLSRREAYQIKVIFQSWKTVARRATAIRRLCAEHILQKTQKRVSLVFAMWRYSTAKRKRIRQLGAQLLLRCESALLLRAIRGWRAVLQHSKRLQVALAFFADRTVLKAWNQWMSFWRESVEARVLARFESLTRAADALFRVTIMQKAFALWTWQKHRLVRVRRFVSIVTGRKLLNAMWAWSNAVKRQKRLMDVGTHVRSSHVLLLVRRCWWSWKRITHACAVIQLNIARRLFRAWRNHVAGMVAYRKDIQRQQHLAIAIERHMLRRAFSVKADMFLAWRHFVRSCARAEHFHNARICETVFVEWLLFTRHRLHTRSVGFVLAQRNRQMLSAYFFQTWRDTASSLRKHNSFLSAAVHFYERRMKHRVVLRWKNRLVHRRARRQRYIVVSKDLASRKRHRCFTAWRCYTRLKRIQRHAVGVYARRLEWHVWTEWCEQARWGRAESFAVRRRIEKCFLWWGDWARSCASKAMKTESAVLFYSRRICLRAIRAWRNYTTQHTLWRRAREAEAVAVRRARMLAACFSSWHKITRMAVRSRAEWVEKIEAAAHYRLLRLVGGVFTAWRTIASASNWERDAAAVSPVANGKSSNVTPRRNVDATERIGGFMGGSTPGHVRGPQAQKLIRSATKHAVPENSIFYRAATQHYPHRQELEMESRHDSLTPKRHLKFSPPVQTHRSSASAITPVANPFPRYKLPSSSAPVSFANTSQASSESSPTSDLTQVDAAEVNSFKELSSRLDISATKYSHISPSRAFALSTSNGRSRSTSGFRRRFGGSSSTNASGTHGLLTRLTLVSGNFGARHNMPESVAIDAMEYDSVDLDTVDLPRVPKLSLDPPPALDASAESTGEVLSSPEQSTSSRRVLSFAEARLADTYLRVRENTN